jgi:hypothetical protein
MSNLSKEQLERLAVLSEELGEIQQIIGKILRFGYDSVSPIDEIKRTNREKLELELGDLQCTLDLMGDENNDISFIRIERQRIKKREKLNKWLQYNKFDE